GRIKDVIIIRGRNHYPQDIESTVQTAHPDLRLGYCAAFEVTRDGQPRLIVVQEIDRRSRHLDAAQIVSAIRRVVAKRHELQVHDVLLVESGSVPKTSSGKVRRSNCRSGYENGALPTWRGRPA